MAANTEERKIYEPPVLTVSLLLKCKSFAVRPVEGCQNIPGITIPPHLMYKGGLGLTAQTIEEQIRPLFNVLDVNNTQETIENLRHIIKTKVTKKEDSVSIAREFLNNFLISDKNITRYLLLLNNVHKMIIKTDDNTELGEGDSIGSLFINECQTTFKKVVCDSNMEILVRYNIDNLDEEREYNSGFSKIVNLLHLFCKLYEQRHSSHVKLTAIQIIFVVMKITDSYLLNHKKMAEYYDDDAEDFIDEEKYEFHKKIIKIYGHALYVLFKDQGKQFYRDQTIKNGISLKSLIDKFTQEIVPKLMEPYLISLCKNLEFD